MCVWERESVCVCVRERESEREREIESERKIESNWVTERFKNTKKNIQKKRERY